MADINDAIAASHAVKVGKQPTVSGDAPVYYRQDVTTTAASISLSPGKYEVLLDGVTTIAIVCDGSTVAEPSSGSSSPGGAYQTGQVYHHNVATTTNASIVALNSGSGKVYLTKLPV